MIQYLWHAATSSHLKIDALIHLQSHPNLHARFMTIALSTFPKVKTLGHDHIPNDILETMPHIFLDILFSIFLTMLRSMLSSGHTKT